MRKQLVLLFGLLAAIFVAPAHAQTTIAFTDGATLELDGRFYVMLAGNVVANGVQGYNVLAPLSLTNCARSNGQAQVVTARPFRWNNGANVIYLATTPRGGIDGLQFAFPFDRAILRVASATGDIVCGGDVPTPPGLDIVYRDGFE
jgi:hypothetical protein